MEGGEEQQAAKSFTGDVAQSKVSSEKGKMLLSRYVDYLVLEL